VPLPVAEPVHQHPEPGIARRTALKADAYDAEAAGLASAFSTFAHAGPGRKLVAGTDFHKWSSTCCENNGLPGKISGTQRLCFLIIREFQVSTRDRYKAIMPSLSGEAA